MAISRPARNKQEEMTIILTSYKEVVTNRFRPSGHFRPSWPLLVDLFKLSLLSFIMADFV
jgi:hypothetical protein